MLTSNVCVDTADYCADWKRKGYCDISSKYHPFMSKNCKLSCEESSCGYWKGRGFCSRTSRHSAYVNKHCPCHCGDVEDDEQSMNWVEKYPDVFEVGFVQGCGSCWAHSALEMVRQMDGIKHIGQSLGLLSVQYLVDCVYPHSKCHCDWHCCCHGFTCLNWISAHGGVPLRETYGDYHSGSNPNTFHECRHVSPVVTTSGARWLHSEAEMARVMVGEGPIAIGIFANGAWYRYSGGSLPPTACASKYTNHAVQCVGYDNAAKVWIVMNSWGIQWGVSAKKPYSHIPGQSGFILLQYGHNTCNILRHPVIAQNVRRVDGFSLEFTEELVEAVPPPAEGPEHQNFV